MAQGSRRTEMRVPFCWAGGPHRSSTMPSQTGIAWRRVVSAKVAPTPPTATHSGNLLASGHRHVSDTSMLWQGDIAQMYPWEEEHWMATRDKDPKDLRGKAGGPDPGRERNACPTVHTYKAGRAVCGYGGRIGKGGSR